MAKIRILVRGSGDIGSAVACQLFRAGYAVVIHDIAEPVATRRKMAFTDAIFDGSARLENVEARLVEKVSLLDGLLAVREIIPLTILNFRELLQAMQPQVLVDARMRKHSQPENQRQLAALTIGLGPNFIAGQSVDLAVETTWGDTLGNIIREGSTSPLAGEPNPIGGHTRDRYVYAPCAGVFHTSHQIGDIVSQGEEIARINETRLAAPLGGVIRGLTHDSVPVEVNTKVIEIDPRLENPQISGILARQARIARGVLLAIQAWEQNPGN